MRTALALLLSGALPGALSLSAEATFELRGAISPPAPIAVSLYSSNSPFGKSLLTGPDGKFRFRDLPAGPYTLSAFAPGKGEVRRTVEIGPGTANARREVSADLTLAGAMLTPDGTGHTVSVRELSVTGTARREYAQAQNDLSKRNIPQAIHHLKQAVEDSPDFVAAWNNLGTIAYQTRRYPEAETYFREALRHDPSSFEPLVNLGGVLLTLGKFDEAWKYNLYAVLSRPQDALANSQLGMTYSALNNLPSALKYLKEAKRIDPVHFSLPQLSLAEIYSKMRNPGAAILELEEFLRYHPDAPNATQVREVIRRLRRNNESSTGGQAAPEWRRVQ